MQGPAWEDQNQRRGDGARLHRDNSCANDNYTPGSHRNNRKRAPRDGHRGWGNAPAVLESHGGSKMQDWGTGTSYNRLERGKGTGPPLPSDNRSHDPWDTPMSTRDDFDQKGQWGRPTPSLTPASDVKVGGILPTPLAAESSGGQGRGAAAGPDSGRGWGCGHKIDRGGWGEGSMNQQKHDGRGHKGGNESREAAGQAGGGLVSGWGEVASPRGVHGAGGSGWGQEVGASLKQVDGGWGDDRGGGWDQLPELPKGPPPDYDLWADVAQTGNPENVDGWNSDVPFTQFTEEERVLRWDYSGALEAFMAAWRGHPLVDPDLEAPLVVWPEKGVDEGRGAEELDSAEKVWEKPSGSSKRWQKGRGKVAKVKPMPLGWCPEDIKFCRPMEVDNRKGY